MRDATHAKPQPAAPSRASGSLYCSADRQRGAGARRTRLAHEHAAPTGNLRVGIERLADGLLVRDLAVPWHPRRHLHLLEESEHASRI